MRTQRERGADDVEVNKCNTISSSRPPKLSLVFLSHSHRFLCPAQNSISAQWEKNNKEEKKRNEHSVGGEREKVPDEGQEVLSGYLDTTEAREERTGG